MEDHTTTQALSRFSSGHLTLVQAARLAGVSVEEFLDLLGQERITVVDYPAGEVAGELVVARTGKSGT